MFFQKNRVKEFDWNYYLTQFFIPVSINVVSNSKLLEDNLFILQIPRINLEEKVYNMDSSQNYVDYHVQILEGSNIQDDFLFLAAHSGNGRNSYFNRLVELEIGDVIWIDKKTRRECFVVEELFYILKTGYLEYKVEREQGILYLITCSLEYNNKQLVVKARLVD